MPPRTVLVSGAGPAGLTLALLLARSGTSVTVVERSPSPRAHGYAVDLRGEALDVAEAIGVLAELERHRTGMGGTTVVDADGRPVSELPAERFGGDLEVPKPALTAALLDAVAALDGGGDVEVVWGDELIGLEDGPDGVRVTTRRGADRTVDLVVGADGVWSGTRRLALGDHGRFVHHLGLSGVGLTTVNRLGLDHAGVLQPEPGRAVYCYATAPDGPMTVSLSFATASPSLDRRPREEQEDAVRRAFAGAGWVVPDLLAAMADAGDLYCASAAQVRAPAWSRGRVVLLGDAAGCAAPTSGMGTSQALLGARELAEQVAALPDDADRDALTCALAGYERALRPVVAENQALGERAAAELGAR